MKEDDPLVLIVKDSIRRERALLGTPDENRQHLRDLLIYLKMLTKHL